MSQKEIEVTRRDKYRERPVYFDNHATTRPDPLVVKAMMPYLTEDYGNASSTDHVYGNNASYAIEEARRRVAELVNARPNEIVFTSGATESNNMAIAGVMEKDVNGKDHMITTEAEHMSVLDTARYLEKKGRCVTYLPVDKFGAVDPQNVRNAITNRTMLVSIMTANNEVGTISDIEVIGGITRKAGVVFHTDAAQGAGHIPINVQTANIDLMSLSAHKLHGPKGAGAVYVRGTSPRVTIEPILHGGGQERGLRSGTANVAAIVGFGKAAELARTHMEGDAKRFRMWSSKVRIEFEAMGGKVLGHPERRLAHNVCVRFPDIEGKAIINTVSNTLAISSGSACTTRSIKPSHVLVAMGLSDEEAHEVIRIGFSRFNTDSDVDRLISCITTALQHIYGMTKI